MVEARRKNKEARSGRDRRSANAAPIPWWVSAIAVLGAVFLTAGAWIALLHPAVLVRPHDAINGAAHIYAGYLASRNLALAVLLLVALVLRARGSLNSFILLTAFIQVLDVAVDCVEHRWVIVPGVIFLALLFAVASWRLSGHPFWRVGAWREDRIGF